MKAVPLVTPREEYRAKTLEALQVVTDSKPDSFVCIYLVDGNINTACAGMSRLETMGAIHAAMITMWDAEDDS